MTLYAINCTATLDDATRLSPDASENLRGIIHEWSQTADLVTESLPYPFAPADATASAAA